MTLSNYSGPAKRSLDLAHARLCTPSFYCWCGRITTGVKVKGKAFIKKLARSVGLLEPLIERQVRITRFTVDGWVRNLRYRIHGAPDGLPIPPAHLIYLVIGSTDISAFLASGRAHAHTLILGTLQKNGFAMDDFENVLDFGCGCGRVMRYWASLKSVNLFGTDFNHKLIDWSKRNLPFASYQVNELRPSLGYESGKFEFIYARSVFTHLPEELQVEWLKELCRVLCPDGLLLFTVSGRGYYSWMTDCEKGKYDSGHLIVREADHAGKNLCAAFHPEEWVRNQLRQYSLTCVDFVPGSPAPYLLQDTYLVQKLDTVQAHDDMHRI
jgi:SAM-dependent methyltransferase